MTITSISASATISLYREESTFLDGSRKPNNLCRGVDPKSLTNCIMETQRKKLDKYDCLPPHLKNFFTADKKVNNTMRYRSNSNSVSDWIFHFAGINLTFRLVCQVRPMYQVQHWRKVLTFSLMLKITATYLAVQSSTQSLILQTSTSLVNLYFFY